MVALTKDAQENTNAMESGAQALKDQGNVHFKNGEYNSALECYFKALSAISECPSESCEEIRVICHKNCAACYLKTGKWSMAVESATHALSSRPRDPKALFRRCQAFEKLERLKDAFADVKLLLQIEPHDQAVQEMARRINASVTSLNEKQHTTTHVVDEMLSALEDGNVPCEKMEKACRNLLILSSEVGGCDVLQEPRNLSRLVSLLDSLPSPEAKAGIWKCLANLSNDELNSTKIKNGLHIHRIRSGLGASQEEVSDAATRFCQAYLDSLLAIPSESDRSKFMYKGDKEKFKPMCKDLVDLLADPGISGVGRDNCLKLLLRNFLRRGGCGLMLLMMKHALLPRCLKLVSRDPETIPVTVNTPLHVSLLLHKFYDDLTSDSERNTYKDYVEAYLKPLFEFITSHEKVSKGMKCLSALLQGPREVGEGLVSTLGAVDAMLELAKCPEIEYQKIALECIIQASGKATVGSAVLQGVEVLQQLFKSEDKEVRAKALVGLCKTGSSGGADKSAKILDNESMFGLAEECRMLMTSEDNFLIRCGVDGIAFLSLDADVKEDLVGDSDALQGLYKVAKSEDQTILHSVANILVNLTNAYDRPQKNEELEKLANFAKYHVPEPHPYDNDDYIESRINRLVESGVIHGLVNAHKSESDATKESFSRVFFAITKEVKHRGKVVQQGGVKALLELTNSGSYRGQLFAAHAIARVAISLNPDQAFPGQRIFELIRPLVKLLHVDCSALQNFEALLALTNITHNSSSVVERLIKDKHTTKIESYMYEEHEMLRRAAVECVVNMVHQSPEMVDKFCAADSDRVKLWTLYSGEWEEDLKLALAASGGLAFLTAERKEVCEKIAHVSNWLSILKEILVHEDVELCRRGVHIINNMVSSEKSIAEEIADSEVFEIFLAYTVSEDAKAKLLKPICEETLSKWKQYGFIKAKSENHATES